MLSITIVHVRAKSNRFVYIWTAASEKRGIMRVRNIWRSKAIATRSVVVAGIFCLALIARAEDITLSNQNHQAVIVHSADGSYEILDETAHRSAIHAGIAAEIDHNWVRSSDYPEHKIQQSSFEDALGHGHRVSLQCTGLSSQPDLTYVIRLYDSLPAGDIEVEVQNHTAKTRTVQMIRLVEGLGGEVIHTGPSESSDRVLSDSFSEDWPPMKIYDLSLIHI